MSGANVEGGHRHCLSDQWRDNGYTPRPQADSPRDISGQKKPPDEALATALMDVLLPGDGVFPKARATDLAARIAAHARFGPTLGPVLEGLPPGFVALHAAAQVAAVAAVEAARPEAFAALLTGVYSLYYTHPAVAGVIAAQLGAPPGPPQPGGFDLAPFDPALVAIPAARGPLYREVPE